MLKVLLVDDDQQALESTRKILELAGHQVVIARDGQAALDAIRTTSPAFAGPFDLVVSDVRMPRLGGLEFLKAVSLLDVATPVILMTAFGRVEDAVWAMKLGAVDFLSKPFKRQALLTAVDNAVIRARRQTSKAATANSYSDILLGNSEQVNNLKVLISQVAKTSASVLVTGESGTGKEVVARSIHEQSARSQKAFVDLNCAAVPEQLIESELFGFEKGAFTGANAAKIGLFEAADGGTLLLDEIGEMPLALQPRLLRALQEGEIRRIGSIASRKVDVRVIAATNRDLRKLIDTGKFRQDLLFRLEVIVLNVPPLRDRLEDVPVMANHFIKIFSERHGKSVESISESAMSLLCRYSWPGNVRELSNIVERALVFSNGGEITVEDLPAHLISIATGATAIAGSMFAVKVGTSLEEVEDLLIRKTLEATDGDKNMTAKLLGINPRTIYRKLEKSD